ncbi:protein containing duf1588 : Uncharacterized protein OS=Pedosphaera parvula (strain Ellin514) GN=Cflav_PD4822 PE=4 SV=1: Cytochrome_CBB3: PSD3: PSD3: PSD5: PSD4: PSCyt3: PSD2 [Gemmataceae bacterium]|nr:protein containing duf1588 : Uncharacterized protein OS=Pedosphaera parvula (strain Ellin514) GN=Cflav_PD4822 PE=4 SV=1: Cytochrome_CBB3: PSD3: PSD3: PSD5: PSD4: PSCyt3: PSD2 [Gemmataceae bacterium]VTT99795.1 protein containing duf1588 : Uncharacterized protein OS=Pedosphaera parvula (strain Ellin514) GN=Cflav_PD4822 PE=4 SV=1: Cytochrome_CBB3: PSD3: PSD3: PSD5: PSD4: PSCyt3: PSD2 [Gemmataceae bacterium]
MLRSLPGLLSAVLVVAAPVRAADFERDVAPVVAKYCGACHGAQKPKGGLDLAKYRTAADARADKPVWKTVAESLRGREMPPEGKPQPTDAERKAVEEWVAAALAEADLGGARDPGRPVLRRLTRLEYNNTVRDLLGLSTDLFPFPERLPFKKAYFDPAAGKLPPQVRVDAYEYGARIPALLGHAGLPGDNRAEHGFSNRGDALNLSPLLFEKYLAVADDLLAVPKLAQAAPRLSGLLAAAGRPSVKAKLAEFLARAFRRPAADAKVEKYLRPYDAAKARGATEAEAVRESLAAVLASPDLIFLSEPLDPKQGPVRPLDGYELAARLSYFLWASAPDDELLAAAKAGTLADPAELERQARRMLKDRKVRELSESFAVQWLRLNELWSAHPDRRFKTFYSGPQGKGTLHADLMAEALLLFEAVLVEDRGVLDFVNADYGYLNKRLIAHYGLTEQFKKQMEDGGLLAPDDRAGLAVQRQKYSTAEQQWIRVRWPDRTRGGFLTCGAVLTLTSTPQRTSPVKRGAWVLESLYNRPPAAPAVMVEPLDEKPAEKSGKTVRAKLEAHRSNPACAGCHAKIDPPGFALENFDPVGGWRTADGPLPIDAAGVLPDGRRFDGPAAFKDAVLAKKDEFVRGFVEHLLSYALGRALEHYDTPEVERIAAAVARDGYRLSRAVAEVVKSYPFRHVRNTPDEGAKK